MTRQTRLLFSFVIFSSLSSGASRLRRSPDREKREKNIGSARIYFLFLFFPVSRVIITPKAFNAAGVGQRSWRLGSLDECCARRRERPNQYKIVEEKCLDGCSVLPAASAVALLFPVTRSVCRPDGHGRRQTGK